MSVEKEVRRAHRRMTFWRLVGDLVELPMRILEGLVAVLSALLRWNAQISRTVFYLELEAARRYILLTETDLAAAMGEAGRYAGLDPEKIRASAAAQQDYMRRLMEEGDEDA